MAKSILKYHLQIKARFLGLYNNFILYFSYFHGTGIIPVVLDYISAKESFDKNFTVAWCAEVKSQKKG